MTMPMDYQHAAENFDRFLLAVIENAGLTTRNQAYTMVQAVFQVFRRRLDLSDAITFANVLPPLQRAVFVAEWDTGQPRLPFADREAMTLEAQNLRRHHNFAPDTCIRDVALALRRTMNEAALDRVLATLPDGAAEFWGAHVSPPD
ncbi:DUF2267 domain-containing protein [Roseiarcaceae bacterium H3SJ34-1]|uniref:DUF2267 domain-containing protein n=1 Tax=Terripilifer ovatus TaxID=3032367 RepID=UPI003AB91EBD|nr:DUF2267 domain-containing protein [Roseiarcaceae bacterium H3SJ34-1]